MNCPGYLIEYNDQRILLDCGNGITRLLNFPNDLVNLNVFISHYHIDHFGDLGLLQYTSYCYHNLGLLKNKMNIYLPDKDIDFSKKMIVSRKEAYAEYYDINDEKEYSIDDLKVSFKDNNSHSINSYMIKIENNAFKIVYTSDVGTTNVKDMIAFCSNADLIICESSFLRKHNSSSQNHLTSFEAGKIAKLSNKKQLLLTHFWPEEDKDLYLKEAKQNFQNTEVAEEGKKLVLRRN